MSLTLEQRAGELNALRKTQQEFFQSNKNANGEYDFTAIQLQEVNDRDKEITEKSKDFLSLKNLADMETKNRKAIEQQGFILSGKDNTFVDLQVLDNPKLSDFYLKNFQKYGKFNKQAKKRDFEDDNFDFKATMTTSAGFAPESLRTGRTVLSAQRPPTILDFIPKVATDFAAVVYMLETTFTNAAVETAEAAALPESTLVYTQQTENIRKVGAFLPVTDEQLEDVEGMKSLVDERLLFMVLQRLDSQILNGNGTAPNINGFYNRVTQSQAKGADTNADAIFKGMNLVRTVGFTEPTAIMMHPNDWALIRLLRTADGLYIWGHPTESINSVIWGVPVVQSTACTVGTVLTGDFSMFSELRIKRGVEMAISDSHASNFTADIQTIKATMRAALVVYRLSAFTEITGIA